MALSDYERRVLADIEVHLNCTPVSLRRPRPRTVVVLTLCLAVVAGIAALGSLLLPVAAAVSLSSLAGLFAGYILAGERERGRLF